MIETPETKERVTQWMNRVLERTVFSKPLKKELILVLGDLFKIYSPSGQEQPVLDYCLPILKKAGFTAYTDTVSNLYAQRTNIPGEKLVCINAHTDTVQSATDSNIADFSQYRWLDDIFTGNGKMLGGDDKCGIAVALTLAVGTTLPMKIIFTASEEVGGKGAESLTQDDFNNVLCCFTIDRRGGSDLISEYCGRTCAPKEFVKSFTEIAKRESGIKFIDVAGSYADTYVISQFVPCVNLSAGYYNAHTDKDFVDVNELYNIMIAVKAAIERAPELSVAISSAPVDWRKDRYAGNPNYVRGRYIYPDYSYYNFGGGFGEFGAWEGGAAVDTGKKPKHEQKSRKVTGQKCLVKYGRLYGRDDLVAGKGGKPVAQSNIAGHLQHTMSTEEGMLLASYNDFKITDEGWDDLLMEGKIRSYVHRIGVDGRVMYRRSMNILPEEKRARLRAAMDATSERAPEELEEEEETGWKHAGRVDSEDFIDKDEVDDLADIGLKSGYLPDTLEYSVFVDFVTGATSIADLKTMWEEGMIDEWFYENAIEMRNEYETDLRLKRLKSIYEEEEYEKGQYIDNKSKLSSDYILDSFDELEKSRIVQFAVGRITPEGWESMMEEHKISMSVYEWGLSERYAFETDGRLQFDYGDPLVTPASGSKSRSRARNACHECETDIPIHHHITNADKSRILAFAIGTTTKIMWKDMLNRKEILKSVYRAGINERRYFHDHHAFSGRFAIYRNNPDRPSDYNTIEESEKLIWEKVELEDRVPDIAPPEEHPVWIEAMLRARNDERRFREEREDRMRQREDREGSSS
jgi:hypothetical protein